MPNFEDRRCQLDVGHRTEGQGLKRLALLLCICLLATSAFWQTEPADASAVVTGPLHTSGNQILDASDRPVRLRGITRVAWETRPATEDEIAHVRGWGANIVRVTMGEDGWNQLCMTKSYDGDYRAHIDDMVQWITSRGMVALLELATNPRFLCDPNADGPQKMAAFPSSATFWQSVADRYKSNPLVAFELYNEPHDISPDVWLRGGTVIDGAVVWRAAGMQQLYDTVRAQGAQNLVFVSGPGFASTPPATLVSGYNVVYAAHMYTCPTNPPPNCKVIKKTGPGGRIWLWVPVENPYDPTPLFDRWASLATQQPVVLTEFGWPSTESGEYNANVIAEAEGRGMSWIAYAWLGSPEGQFSLVADTGPNYDPTPAGVPVKDGLSVTP